MKEVRAMNSPIGSLHTVWTLASKDIVDSLRNKLIMSLILGMGLMLLMPKAMGAMLVPPETLVLVYDPGGARLTAELENSDQLQVRRVRSLAELEQVIEPRRSSKGPA